MVLVRSHLDTRRFGTDAKLLNDSQHMMDSHYGLDWAATELRVKGATIALVSLYLTCGIGLSGINLEKLAQVLLFIKMIGYPTLIGADWNMTPEELIAWCVKNDMYIITPADLQHTCDTGRMLDYFVATRSMKSMLSQAKGYQAVPWGTHVGFGLSSFSLCFSEPDL